MTHAAALQHIADTLRGQEITSSINGRPVPGFAVVSREALATLVDGDWTVRPLGVVESEAKRENAGTSGAQQECEPVANAVESTAAPSPVRCAECGTALFDYEIARIEQAKGSKFEQLCSDCTRMALGISR